MQRLIEPVLGGATAEKPAHRLMQLAGLFACVGIAAFILYTQAFGRFPPQVQYGVVLTLAIAAVFLLKPGPLARRGQRTVADMALSLVLIGMALYAGGYLLANYEEIAALREGLPNRADLWCYAIGTIAVLFAAHRAEGWLLMSVVAFAIVYLLFGQYFPGVLEHRPFRLAKVLEISYSYQGIFGVALGAVVDVVYIFVILGVALRVTGAGEFFNDLALMLTRGRRSGPAQCAIVGSALFGSINGSAPANVSATGVLTIPLMKRAGYAPRFAGGVEATASCVGQIMPPVMGVGAFIMSDITGVPYVTIMLVALAPALLFIASLMVAAALEAGRLDLTALEQERVAWTGQRRARAFILLAGFGTLLALLFSGYPATYCGLIAIGVVLGLAVLIPQTRPTWRQLWVFLVDSGRDGLSVALACAAIGIVIGAVTTTGLGVKLNQMIVALGSAHLLYALVLAALCSILLGMGLPTAASYLMVIFVAGPAIMDLGVPQLQAHLFVFYYAVLSAITPPVALAVFAAAAIAGEKPVPIAINALRLCFVGLILPIAWIYHPELLLGVLSLGELPAALAFLATMIVAIVAISAAHIGFFGGRIGLPERAALAAAAVAIVYPDPISNVAGTVAALALLGLRYWRSTRVASA